MQTARTPGSQWTVVISRLAEGVAVVTIGVVVATAWAYFFVAQPMNDDFSSMERDVRGMGAFQYAHSLYFRWSGRWASHILVQLTFNNVDAFRHYWAMLAGVGLVDLCAFYAGGRALLGDRVSRKGCALLALGVFALLWAAQPWPRQTVYWFSAGVPYRLGPSLLIVLIACLSRQKGRDTPRALRAVQVALLAALAVFICGTHELVALVACALLAFGTLAAYRAGTRNRADWAVVLLFGVAGFLFAFLAPGNAARGEGMTRGGDLTKTLDLLRRHVSILWPRWVLDPKLLAATALLVLHRPIATLRPDWSRLPGVPWRIAVPGLALVLTLGCLAANPWVTGVRANGRTLDFAYTIFLLTYLISVFIVTRGWRIPQPLEPVGRLLGAAALLTLAVTLFTTGNTRTALPDLASGRASAWSDAVSARFETMRDEGLGPRAPTAGPSRYRPNLVIAELPECPRVLWGYPDRPGQFAKDPRHWSNTGLAEIFGLESVRLESESPEFPLSPLAIEVTARAGDLVEVRVTGPQRAQYSLSVQELVGEARGVVSARSLADPATLTGRLDRFGATHRRIGLPRPTDASVVGWRLLLAPGERAPAASSVDVPLEPVPEKSE